MLFPELTIFPRKGGGCMKNIFVPLICLAVLLFIISSARADFKTYVIYQEGEEPCTTGDGYFEHKKNENDLYCSPIFYEKGTNSCDDGFAGFSDEYHEFLDENASLTYCVNTPYKDVVERFNYQNQKWVLDKNDVAYAKEPTGTARNDSNRFCRNAIQDAYYRIAGSYGDTIIVCPGALNEQGEYVPYKENIKRFGSNETIKSYSQNPEDTIIEAIDPDRNVFYVIGGHLHTIAGLTIKGATGEGFDTGGGQFACIKRYNFDGEPESFFESPTQPCAGIRFYGTRVNFAYNNHITGNNHGIIVKDTYWGWSFFTFIENNEIYDNEVGVHLRYASNSYVNNNRIYDNNTDQIGISLVDTWQNKVVGNTIENNGTGIEIKASLIDHEVWGLYPEGEATSDNRIYNNNILNNTQQVYDDKPEPVPITKGVLSVYCLGSSGEECQHYWYEPVLQVGNFWSAYPGEDDGSNGRTPDDGIGDTYIPWPAANYDEYPRMLLYDYSSADLDGDGIANYADNCPDAYNPLQEDIDGNGRGNACECSDNKQVRNMTDEIDFVYYYGTLNSAYNVTDNEGYCYDEVEGKMKSKPAKWDKFQIRAGVYDEDLEITYTPGFCTGGDIDHRKYINFFNGYDCNYTANNGVTTLKGELKVSSGNLIIRKGTFKVAKSS